jgi:hypothetical protein
MNPVTFVDGANLQWAHDHGCDNDFVVENPIADLLGQPNEYEHRVDRGVFPRCGKHSGRHYDSQDYTRSFDDGNPERENIAGEEGFYLDFDEGSEPDAFSPLPVWTERTTLADGNTALTYWFFYGRSVPRWNGIGLPSQHEGDWEHVNLIMDATTLVPGRGLVLCPWRRTRSPAVRGTNAHGVHPPRGVQRQDCARLLSHDRRDRRLQRTWMHRGHPGGRRRRLGDVARRPFRDGPGVVRVRRRLGRQGRGRRYDRAARSFLVQEPGLRSGVENERRGERLARWRGPVTGSGPARGASPRTGDGCRRGL